MRVIWVTSQHPRPEGGAGTALELNLMRGAVERHDVHVIMPELAASPSGNHEPPIDEVRALGVSIETVAWRQLPLPTNRAAWFWTNLTRVPPYGLWQFNDRPRQLHAALRRAEAEREPDLVHITLGEIAEVARGIRTPTALLLFDSYTRQLEREIAHTRGRRRWLMRYHRRRMASWEKSAYRHADAVATLSDTDAASLSTLLGRPVTVMTNPIEDAFFEPPTRARTTNEVVFVGTLDYRPNTDAVEWLAYEMWPTVTQRVPDARLVVVGRAPPPEVRKAVAHVGGEVHGDVPDVRPYYWGAAVAVAPIRLGSGVRNKQLHAIASRAPLVTTSIALDGVPGRPGEHVLVADTTAAFADAIVRSLQDPAAAAARADAAFVAVESLRVGQTHDMMDDWWLAAKNGVG